MEKDLQGETSGRSLVLIGSRGSGKTSLGRLLAERISLQFVDTDDVIRQLAGESIEAMFERGEEPRFRQLEHDVIHSLESTTRAVVATGGGVVVDPRNRSVLRRLGCVVLLLAPTSVLAARISGTARPSLTGKPPTTELEEVFRRREPAYRETAHCVLYTGASGLEETCDELQQLWTDFEGHNIR